MDIFQWLEGAIPPAAFLVILWALLEPKCSRTTARWALLGFLGAQAVLQGLLLAWGDSLELVLTLLPLTLCFPAIAGVHLLSRRPFVPTAVIWLTALLCQHLLLAARKLLVLLMPQPSGFYWQVAAWGLLLLAATGLTVAVLRFFRPPFLSLARELDESWSPLFLLPVMLLALHAYFLSIVTSPGGLLLLLSTALAALWALIQLMNALVAGARSRQSQAQMEALRRDYELLQKKLELGRSYRHDMRHHMQALSALLQQGESEEALRYISHWQGQLTQVESQIWCRSAPVNAVLSAYLTQAEEAGCRVEMEVSLNSSLPVEELDLCMVLANALENAIHACQAMPPDKARTIRLELTLTDHQRLTIHMENTAPWDVELDDNGFPITEHREGHGQGLKSIAAVAEKYHGMFQCGCQDGIFSLWVVLLDSAPEPRPVRRAPAVCAAAFLSLFLLNCMPALAQTLEALPVLGPVIRVVDVRTYGWLWGGTGVSVQEPVLEGSGQSLEGVQAEKEAFLQQMEESFVHHAARKYQGYVAQDIGYEVVRDDEALFILRFDATLNAGGSMDYHRHIVLDKQADKVLTLADLFQSEANYVFPISREIKAQMAEQMKAGEGNYFLPGGIWSEEECFQSIDGEEQDFYISEAGQLVIAFAEYEVAPGSMGAPEFVIPTDVLDGLLAQPSLLQ